MTDDTRPAAKAHRAETGHDMALVSAVASSCAECDWSTSESVTDPRSGSLASGEVEHALAALAALRYVHAPPESKLKEMAYDEVKGMIERLSHRPDSDPHTETLWEGPAGQLAASLLATKPSAHGWDPNERVRVVRDKGQP